MRNRRMKRRKKLKKRKHAYPASEAPWRLPLISGMLQKSNPHDTRRFEFAIFTELPTNKSSKVLHTGYLFNGVPEHRNCHGVSAYHCIPLHPPLIYEVNGQMAGGANKRAWRGQVDQSIALILWPLFHCRHSKPHRKVTWLSSYCLNQSCHANQMNTLKTEIYLHYIQQSSSYLTLNTASILKTNNLKL